MNKNVNLKTNYKVSRKNTKLDLMTIILNLLNNVKIYHWKTRSYSVHKATDELYEKLNEQIDQFVEVLLGKKRNISVNREQILKLESIKIKNFNFKIFKKEIEKYKIILINLTKDKLIKEDEDMDLINIRDEMLATLNQFTYLLTLK